LKSHPSWWFGFVFLLVGACSTDTEVAGGAGPCTDAPSVTRAELEAGAVLCEGQTLVAPIHPGDDLKVSLRILTPGEVDLCFDDDDQERHEVSLMGMSVVAQTPCQTVTLPAGDHTLDLRHALRDAGRIDALADVLHTKWTPPTSTSHGRLQVSSNSCPGCTLVGRWPASQGLPYPEYGYTGNYANAIIDGPCEDYLGGGRNSACQLGSYGTHSSFERAQIVIHPVSDRSVPSIGDRAQIIPAPAHNDTNLRGATVTLRGPAVLNAVDATGATFLGEGELIYINETDFAAIDLSRYRGVASTVFYSRMDVVTYATLVARAAEQNAAHDPRFGKIEIRKLVVTIAQGQRLAGLNIDFSPAPASLEDLSFVWPVDASGLLSMAGASFDNATLRNLTMPCAVHGNLRGASFAFATLENVDLTSCDLTDARFYGSTFTNVKARGTKPAMGGVDTSTLLVRADLTNVKVDGLDVGGANMSGATLSSAPNSPWSRVEGRGLYADSLHAAGLRLRSARFVDAELLRADFSGAELQGVLFQSSDLSGTNFSGAALDEASFESAFGSGLGFEAAHFASGHGYLNRPRFDASNFRGALMQGMPIVRGRICGGDFTGANLEGADLTGTLMPVVSDTFFRPNETFDCVANKNLATVPTDATTKCPDKTPGPCSATSWVPSEYVPQCPVNLPRQTSGSSCTTKCDCESLSCKASKCV
jgi:uncharacterized protein YjbI with pentapeptide repeats